MRKLEFACEEYYHIYNRGVDKRDVFLDEGDYERFLLCMHLLNDEDVGQMEKLRNERNPKVRPSEFRRSNLGIPEARQKLVDIICYCLNPNHFHFILKQLRDGGIVKFMQKLGTSYVMYFNKKYERSGVLFQGKYKAIHIDSNEYLLYLSTYINANHFIHGYEKRELSSHGRSAPKDWPYSSLPDYTGKRDGKLCDKEPVLGQFDNDFSQYEKYLKDNAAHFREKKEMEKYYLE